ncbi:hypothetical protein TURU_086131 [Turdus rufiventris]|nr:hypothetical protein TURU_086131 [Turdus rufiventris]
MLWHSLCHGISPGSTEQHVHRTFEHSRDGDSTTSQGTHDQQCDLWAGKANGILGCVGKGMASRLRNMILSLCSVPVKHIWSPGEAHLECPAPFWVPQGKGGMELLEQVQGRTVTMMKGLEHLSYKEKLGLFSLEKIRLRGNLIPVCVCREGSEHGPGSAPGASNGTGGTGRN